MRVHNSLFLAHRNNVSVDPDDHHRTRPVGQKKAVRAANQLFVPRARETGCRKKAGAGAAADCLAWQAAGCLLVDITVAGGYVDGL